LNNLNTNQRREVRVVPLEKGISELGSDMNELDENPLRRLE